MAAPTHSEAMEIMWPICSGAPAEEIGRPQWNLSPKA